MSSFSFESSDWRLRSCNASLDSVRRTSTRAPDETTLVIEEEGVQRSRRVLLSLVVRHRLHSAVPNGVLSVVIKV
ncbi:hypothetical protein NDU88_009759 [Pleurodeles waltl]|uniref:Uncharacterized protein n=1 Tax=Pleurodeles waltl TaxID=8319 RepID=A0AAV7RXH7_PLEWA|nr:hypothetical protein NDU88_009759 [Pleurodeles waltl]